MREIRDLDAAIVAQAILRRPSALCPRAAPPAGCRGGPGLPGFLRPRRDGGGAGGLWKDGDGPVRIRGFEPGEDVVSLTFLGPGPLPALSLRTDEKRRVTTILANGKPVAAIHGAGPGFSLANIETVLRAR